MRGAPAGGGRLAARFVALDATHCLAPGEVVWDAAGRIVALRRCRGEVEDVCILPGLVDAHAHVQLGRLAAPERDFVPWIGAVMAARAAVTRRDERATARQGIAALLASGTTAIGDIDSTGVAASVLARSRPASRVYRELTGFHLEPKAARRLVAERWRERQPGLASGLSPHAPYSVSAPLFRAAAAVTRWLAIHCAEVPEEVEFLRTGRGPFRDLLARLGRLPAGFRAPGLSPVAWLDVLGVLRPTTLLIHCQELVRGDTARIAAAGASIAVCPGTIDYFRRSPPPVERWLQAGIPVALGTDSWASNVGLSMREELRRAARLWPSLSPAQLMAMATQNGARALGLPTVGALRRGGRADLLVVAAAPTWPATLESFVHGDAVLRQVWCRGLRCRAPGWTARSSRLPAGS